MSNKTINDVPVYTDIQDLAKINTEYLINPDKAKMQVAEQFASLFLQMVLNSMREANNVISSDLFNSQEMGIYQDLFDKQLSLTLASQSNGLVGLIKKNIDQHLPAGAPPAVATAPSKPPLLNKNPISKAATPVSATINTPEDFVRVLWPAAQTAAKALQLNPEVLIAQAALETNWGKSIIHHPEAGSSYNLFNIKADSNWTQKVATATTLEEQDEVLVKQKAKFKVYSSYLDSFLDYVSLLKDKQRYSRALTETTDPQSFVKELQAAGFATDSHYAEKIWQICNSKSFKQIVLKVSI